MLYLIRSLGLAALAMLAFQAQAEETNPARQASEIIPTPSQQGTTANRGPTHYGFNGEKSEKSEQAEKSESTEKAEKAEEHKDSHGKEEEKHEKHKNKDKTKDKNKDKDKDTANAEKEEACNGNSCQSDANCAQTQARAGSGECQMPGAGCEANANATAEAEALKTERAKVEFDRKMRAAIRKLSTSGWREAQVELVGAGKEAIPYLIDALAVKDEGEVAPAYNLGGHVKADAGRAPRQRSVADVASELLTNIVSNHSTYKGDLPTFDQKAWQEWWIVNAETVTFSK